MYIYQMQENANVCQEVVAEDMQDACEQLGLDIDDLSGNETMGMCEGNVVICIGDYEEEDDE